jgi:hypothetical protein
MSGIFLAFSYVIMTLLVFKSRKINLIAIFSGGVLSFLPSIPLLIHVFANPSSPSNKKIFSFFELKFLWYTLIQGAGIDIFYHLGKSSLSFIKYPTFCGIDTYFTGIIYFLMIVSIISGVYFLCKETEEILPYFSQINIFDIQKQIQNTTLKNSTNSNDRSGYLIYQDIKKINLL